MDSINNKHLLDFAKIIAGGYTNKLQAQKDSKNFPHINFYFIPISWSILNAPAFYSEQSYEYDPWAPYRQNVHKLIFNNMTLIMENYMIINKERIAGAYQNPKLLKEIKKEKISIRSGCSMVFESLKFGHYIGEVEAGKKCLIYRSKESTYLISKVEIKNKVWTSEERGLNTTTDRYVWGSEKGPFIFNKIVDLGQDLGEEWIDGKKSSNN